MDLKTALTVGVDPGKMRVLPLLLWLAACSSPSPDFIWADAERSTVRVSGMPFTVWHTASYAQATRESGYTRLPVQLLQARAVVAIARATGCRVLRQTVVGGAVRTDARINCSAR
ncbi:MAG: hypothetical protein AAF393_01225 [Pseudomonadota bacterium]